MTEVFLIGAIVLLAVVVAILVWRSTSRDARDAEPLRGEIAETTERLERGLREEIARSREESGRNAAQAREEMRSSVSQLTDGVRSQLADSATLQKEQLDVFSRQLQVMINTNDQRLERMRETVESRLTALQEDNNRKLEQMRSTVDEKLHATLEHRLGESFKQVSERLEQVHKGLGEMQTLATGVGDLKRVPTNVKSRGTWGEFQLGNILEQILTPDQYSRNVATKVGSNDRVEYAVKLPGREGENGKNVWLPIDAKFPQEDYQRLVDAQEQVNPTVVEEAGKQLEARIRMEARTIKEKYLDPPHTTDFAILFLPTEGLYAEVLRRPGVADTLQRESRVTIAGPTTLAAILNSLQMGFRTLAIERRSSEVWSLLAAVKQEFTRFGEILDKTQKKLQEASNTIETAAVKSRTIERKLRTVHQLPSQETLPLLSPAEEEENDP